MLFSLLVPQSSHAHCERPVHIQLVQVQDGTASFADDIEVMKSVMGDVIGDLSEDFGPLDFGLVEFSDKPQIITGYGKNLGVGKYFTGKEEDFCYRRVAPLSKTVDLSGIVLGGGKDDHENQWDALAMSSMDPDMNWYEGDVDEEGRILIKLAVLITDAGAHRASPQDFEPEQRNWYHEELFGGPCGYDEKDTCTENFGESSSKSHMALGLKNLIDHYNWFKAGNDSELLTNTEYSVWDYHTQFNAFRYCCTAAYATFPQAYYTDCNAAGLGSYAACAKVSCKRCPKCSCDDREFEVDWMKDIDIPEIPIADYVYGKGRFDDSVDCKTMEYPDPFSKEYADIFKIEGVTPVLFLRLPDTMPVQGSNEWPWQWMDMFKGNQTCPKAGQRLSRFWLCKADLEVADPKKIKGHWKPNGITTTGVCDGYDPSELNLNDFYNDCFKEHYGEPVEAIKANGVNAYMSIVTADVEGKGFTDKLKQYIRDVMDNHPSCRSTTTTTTTTEANLSGVTLAPAEPSTTATVATTTTTEANLSGVTLAPAEPSTTATVATTTTTDPTTTATVATTTTTDPTTTATVATTTTTDPATTATVATTTTTDPTTTATVATTDSSTTATVATTTTTTDPSTTTKTAATTTTTTKTAATTTTTTKTAATTTTTTKTAATTTTTTKTAATTTTTTKTAATTTTTTTEANLSGVTRAPANTSTTTTVATTTTTEATLSGVTLAPAEPTLPTDAPITKATASTPAEDTDEEESTGPGASTPVIVGSAAAGVAAIGAGAALWAKGLMPGLNSSVTDTHIENSNLKQDVQEREQLTEVNANMFL